MKKKLPKKHLPGLKLYCKTCRKDQPRHCRHEQIYRIRLHVKGTKNKVKIKELTATSYDEAVQEGLQFKKEMEATNYGRVSTAIYTPKISYTLPEAILFFRRHLSGEHPLAHKRREAASKSHIEEWMRYCVIFCDVVKKRTALERLDITNIIDDDISKFHELVAERYSPITARKVRMALTQLFDLIIAEGVTMSNPFTGFNIKKAAKKEPETLTTAEFKKIIAEIEKDRIALSNGEKIDTSYYRPYLQSTYWAALLLGVRREELFSIMWSEIIEYNDIKFFKTHNLKTERIVKQGAVYKYIPISADLQELLNSLGHEKLAGTSDYILYPERTETIQTLMEVTSRSFTHYKTRAGITKDISFKHLRKSYVSLLHYHLGKDTGMLTSQSERIMVEHYLDPKLVSAIEKAALNVKLFA